MASKHTISAHQLAEISQVKSAEIDYWLARTEKTACWPVEVESRFVKRFTYRDALAVETARQMNDASSITSGPSILEALRIVSYTNAIPAYLDYDAIQKHLAKPMTDFWVAVSSARNTWGSYPRGNTPKVTGFGPGEYWSDMHFAGTYDQVSQGIKQWMTDETIKYPDTDPARIIWVNVSSAERRLAKRAKTLGIDIIEREFVTE